ncbi:hypothetical protein KAU93_03495, partial [Candidatus Bathyarchaeota archaeon]|nr:hypothetical protein [Candidatus Bathyarchaeota archaeon]
MVKLRENEQKTLLVLEKLGGRAAVKQITSVSGLAYAAIIRAALVLKAKRLVKIHEQKQTTVTLNQEGKLYAQRGLPERRTLNAAYQRGGEISISDIPHEIDMPSSSIPIALAWLIQKDWATIDKEKGTVRLTKKQKPPKGDDEKLLALLARKGTVVVEELDKSLRHIVATLRRRKLIETKERTLHELKLTEQGWKLIKKGIEVSEEVSQLTPELIITGKWRRKKLRKFDVTAPGPTVYPGKVHPLQQIVQRAREIFLEMGFTEIRGPLIETAFWNFDALFQP